MRRTACRSRTSASTASSISRRTTTRTSIRSKAKWRGTARRSSRRTSSSSARRIAAGTAPRTMKNTKGYIRGYDARTGKRLWIFHTIPQPGEFGNDTWLEKSWEYTGNTGVWTQITVDENLGIAYLPVEDPTGDYFGGHRPGNNLFGSSLVAVDLQTGKRIWHFQLNHHPIWDYDIPCAPMLVDITVDGKKIAAIAQPTKQGFTFVFDRKTGAAGVADRRAPGRTRHAAARVVFADAALPHQAAGVRAQRLHRGHGDRLHARAEGRGAEDPAGLQDRTDLHAADRQGRRRQDRHDVHPERRELAGRRVRSGNRNDVRLLAFAAARVVDGQRSEAIGHGLHQRRRDARRRRWRRRVGAGPAADQAALRTHQRDRSEQGRAGVADRARRHAGCDQEQSGAQGAERFRAPDGPPARAAAPAASARWSRRRW